MRRVRQILLFLLVVFILPALASAAWWQVQDRPRSWSAADWSSSGMLAAEAATSGPSIFVMAARTGGLKGAFSVHSWIVVKKAGAAAFDRYDKVGWGLPVRKNAFAADGYWYSNLPEIIHAVRGEEARRLIPAVEQAISNYPHAGPGDYRTWPGPNSNSFVAHILRAVPELGGSLPPNAVGRDFVPDLFSFAWSRDGRDVHASLGGLIGFAVGVRSGLEMHFLGLVAGLDFLKPAVKIPAFGRLDLARSDDSGH